MILNWSPTDSQVLRQTQQQEALDEEVDPTQIHTSAAMF